MKIADFLKKLIKKKVKIEDLFRLDESHLSLAFLLPYLTSLQDQGINFDFSEVPGEEDPEQYIAIDCEQYVKFVSLEKFSRENFIDRLFPIFTCIRKLGPEVDNWLQKSISPSLLSDQYSRDEFRSILRKIPHILDWMESLGTKAPSIVNKQLKYSKALDLTEDWVKQLNKSIPKSPGKVEIIKRFDNGFYVCRLLDSAARKWEGYHMSHCVGGDAYQDHVGLYSLRDNKGLPHATIEIDECGQVVQIQGKGNGSVADLYGSLVFSFLCETTFDIDGFTVLDNLGIESIPQDCADEIKEYFKNGKFFERKQEGAGFWYFSTRSKLIFKNKLALKKAKLFDSFYYIRDSLSLQDMEFILSHGICKDQRVLSDCLTWGVRHKKVEITKLLLNTKAVLAVNWKDIYWTAICDNDSTEILVLLLNHTLGKKVEIRYGPWGIDQALEHACELGYEKVVKVLLEAGVKPSLYCKEIFAREDTSFEIKMLLIPYFSNVERKENLIRFKPFSNDLTVRGFSVK